MMKHRSTALLACAAALGLLVPFAAAQKVRTEVAYVYRVVRFAYNPGERATDEARAQAFERELNEMAREGWEPVGSLLDRNNVQTVGGAITTRDTVSFVAFRRPR